LIPDWSEKSGAASYHHAVLRNDESLRIACSETLKQFGQSLFLVRTD
jgi:hypothetical protein